MNPSPRRATVLNITSREDAEGFTLTEVLVAAALGLIVVAAAGAVIVQHIRTTTVQSVQLRFDNDWGRVSQFIETEVGEGLSLSNTPVANCPGTNLFTINIPVLTGLDTALTNTAISYNQSGPDLVRCGPPIKPDGTLDTGAVNPNPQVLLTNAIMNRNALNARLVEYNITFSDPSPPGFNAPFQRTYPAANQFVQARTKANYIDN